MRRIALGAAQLAALAAGLAGCTRDPGFTGVAGVREATAAEVAVCTYVSDIRMRPGTYGVLADQGLKYARNTIMADARDDCQMGIRQVFGRFVCAVSHSRPHVHFYLSSK